MSRKPAIIGAMDSEIAMYLEHGEVKAEHKWHEFVFYEMNLKGVDCIVSKSGIGKVMSAMVCQHLIDTYAPTEIIFTGVAGALNTNLDIGDVVVSKDCMQHDIDGRALGFPRGTILFSDKSLFEADDELHDLAMASHVDGHRIYSGRILTGDQFFTHKDIEDHAYLTTDMAGDCIEMEGGSIGLVCAENNVPFVIVRTISDKADGSAAEDFSKLHHLVAGNSYSIVSQMLPKL
ncbi:MAG: 5'-methylthioadenosine/adenosylhomocysteine nucleosidase [Lentisphaeraceae bacterium]|nr:5'-methylthioadenosine/adenosylhomocysteine nucleosidase [Lentisphaeraceae bacterium]